MFFDPVLLMIYVGSCAIVGLCGRFRSIGFSGIFSAALFVSPVVVGLVLLITAPAKQAKSS
jgi:hypothetical protein